MSLWRRALKRGGGAEERSSLPLARKTRCIIYVPFPLLLIAPDTMVGDSHL